MGLKEMLVIELADFDFSRSFVKKMLALVVMIDTCDMNKFILCRAALSDLCGIEAFIWNFTLLDYLFFMSSLTLMNYGMFCEKVTNERKFLHNTWAFQKIPADQ